MLTQGQIKDMVYDALASDTALNDLIDGRVFWLGSDVINNEFPKIVYFVYDTVGSYSFNDGTLGQISEEYGIQINTYTDPSEISDMDDIIDRVRAIMTGLCFRNTSSPVEFLDSEISKIVRPTRWDYINV